MATDRARAPSPGRPAPSGRASPAARRYFLVEHYVPSMHPPDVDAASARLIRAGGACARHLATVLIPDEETCLSLFEAPGPAPVAAAAARAGFSADRIVEVSLFGSGRGRSL